MWRIEKHKLEESKFRGEKLQLFVVLAPRFQQQIVVCNFIKSISKLVSQPLNYEVAPMLLYKVSVHKISSNTLCQHQNRFIGFFSLCRWWNYVKLSCFSFFIPFLSHTQHNLPCIIERRFSTQNVIAAGL